MIVTNFFAKFFLWLANKGTPGAVAVTIWPFIFIWPKEFAFEDAVILHERKHIEQWERYFIIGFIVLYLYHHITKGYWENPLEIEAREAERINEQRK